MEHPGAEEYKVVIAPASDPTDKSTYRTSGTEHGFLNLTPDTEYVVRVGVKGDDSTQSILNVRTLPVGEATHSSMIHLGADPARIGTRTSIHTKPSRGAERQW